MSSLRDLIFSQSQSQHDVSSIDELLDRREEIFTSKPFKYSTEVVQEQESEARDGGDFEYRANRSRYEGPFYSAVPYARNKRLKMHPDFR